MGIFNSTSFAAKAYYRIHGFEVDEDSGKAVFRVKIYPDKRAREAGSDIREMRKEYPVDRFELRKAFEKQATKYVQDHVDLEGEAKKHYAQINEERDQAKMPPLTTSEMRTAKEQLRVAMIVEHQKRLADLTRETILKELTGKSKLKKTFKQVGYEYLALLPEFEGCQADD